MNTPSTEWPSSLTDEELDELDRYLRGHAEEGRLLLDGVHGMLSAIAVGPLEVLPDEWLPEVLHDPFADEAEGNRVLELLAKLNDSIRVELDVDAYEPILGEVDTDTGPVLSAAGWCEGFSRGIDLRAGLWEKRLADDPQLMELLGPVMALAVDEGILSAEAEFEKLSDEEYDQCLAQVAPVLGAVDQYWHEHPATEEELAALARAPATEGEQAPPPPRQRSGHWVH
ncbi:MAG: YecA family protein [Frateuria sp.]|uniref:YecA/YgfB family protein n=1 Tax=Frateuria sp. TaxID=2211372 RepID=UPI001801D24E|nr:YecA family protein [Frateuria sp.]NUO71763.1 YecA family protein [Frateuria sp.]NUR23714.1 YecA family protein [Frateuria sp.]